MYALVPVALPQGVVTTTLTTTAPWAGVVAVIEVSLFTVNDADVPPMVTTVAPVKAVPVINWFNPAANGAARG